MKYTDGTKIELLDKVQLESGKKGVIVAFDKVNERDYVQIRIKEKNNVGKLWASINAVTKN